MSGRWEITETNRSFFMDKNHGFSIANLDYQGATDFDCSQGHFIPMVVSSVRDWWLKKPIIVNNNSPSFQCVTPLFWLNR